MNATTISMVVDDGITRELLFFLCLGIASGLEISLITDQRAKMTTWKTTYISRPLRPPPGS